MYKPDRKQMIWTIIDAMQHGRVPSQSLSGRFLCFYTIDEHDCLTFNVEKFQYVEHANPYFVWFEKDNKETISVPLSMLEDASLFELYTVFK